MKKKPPYIAFNHVTIKAQKHKRNIMHRISQIITSGDSFFSGRETQKLEESLTNFMGGGHITTVSSGHDALLIALSSLNLQKTDEIIFPVNAYPTAFPAYLVNATIVLVDIDENGQMDVSDLKRKLTKKTKVIIVVHMYGLVGEIEEILKIARSKNISLIEDCAQSFGTLYNGKPVGTFGDIACFSFYPTKNLATLGDGGALFTKNKKLFSYFLKAKAYGEKDRYKSEFVFGHSRLGELQAAVLNVYLETISRDFKQRKKLAEYYTKRIRNLSLDSNLRILSSHPKSDPVHHVFVVVTKKRNTLQEFLKEKNIPTLIHYPYPVHLVPSFSFLGYKKGDFPNAERLAHSIISLPFHAFLTEKDVNYITENLKRFYHST